MKRLIAILPLMLGLILFSCGDAESGDNDAENGVDGELGGGSHPTAAIEVSSEMAAFIGAFDGNSESVESGLELYGANEEIVDHDMGMYNLEDPNVTAKDGECYTVVCKSGMVENTYEICWEEGKIVSITGG